MVDPAKSVTAGDSSTSSLNWTESGSIGVPSPGPIWTGFRAPPLELPTETPPNQLSLVEKALTPSARSPVRLTSAMRTWTWTCCTPATRVAST